MTHLGDIVVAQGAAQNNTTTAVPFALPAGLQRIEIEVVADMLSQSGDPSYVEIGSGDNTFQTSADTGFLFGNDGPLGLTAGGIPSPVLSLYNAGTGSKTYRIFAAAGPANVG